MKKVLICFCLIIAFFSYGCSSKPMLTAEEEGPYNECEALIKQASVDLDSAKQAGAEAFAKDSFNTASLSLKDAKKFLEKKDFSNAKENAVRSSIEAKNARDSKKQAEAGIIETEKQINAAKTAKIDEESPVAFKEAVNQLESAKKAYNSSDLPLSNLCVLKAAIAIKKANEELVAAKNAFNAAEADMAKAKELKIDTVSPDSFKIATEAFELSKSSLGAKNNITALESAVKTSAILKDEMKKSCNLFIEQAKTDLSAAKEAGASEFAADQLAVAEESLSAANAAIEKSDFVTAKGSAEKASVLSKEAETKAKEGKEAKTAAVAALMTPEAKVETIVVTPEPKAVTVPKVDTVVTVPKPKAIAAVATPEPKVNTVVTVPKPKAVVKTEKPAVKSIKTNETNNVKSVKKVDEKIPLPHVAAKKTAKSENKFPVIPVAIAAIIVVIIAVLLIIRMVRKKVTSKKSV